MATFAVFEKIVFNYYNNSNNNSNSNLALSGENTSDRKQPKVTPPETIPKSDFIQVKGSHIDVKA